MKRYGRKTPKHNIPDNHPQKGYINWWEYEFECGNKKMVIQDAKKEIEMDIDKEKECEDFEA